MNCIYKLSDLNFAGTGCPILQGLCTCICGRIRSLFFSPRGFQGFRIRQIHLKSVPAHHRPKQGLRLSNNDYCVLSWKADQVSRIFFPRSGPHSRQSNSPSLLQQVNVPGACSFNSQFNLCTDCVTFSSSLARPQHVRLRLTSIKLAVLMGQSLIIACVLYCALLFH